MPTLIPIDQLHPSPSNPRRTFGQAGLEELAASIRSAGVLQPLCVRRRLPDLCSQPAPEDGYELVFGHRRLRAAQMAGLAEVPCDIVDMSDAEVLQAQVAENLEREDLHPLEEAEGFEALMRGTGLSADALAEQTGKSRSYIYGRLKLCKLCPEARQAYVDGRFEGEIALMIARLPSAKMQLQALTVVREQGYRFGQGYRAVRAELLDRFTLDLEAAIFDPADAFLLRDAGACTTCPKLAGNAPEYADALGGESQRYTTRTVRAQTCTDPDCFAAKKTAHLRNKARELEDAGEQVITGSKAKAAMGADGKLKGDYVPLTGPGVAKALRDAKAAAARDPKLQAPVVLTVQCPRTGRTVQAVRRSALTEAGAVLPVGAKAASAERRASQAARPVDVDAAKAEASRLTEQRIALLDAVLAAAQQQPRDAEDLRMIVRLVILTLQEEWQSESALNLVASRHGLQYVQDLLGRVELLPPDALALLLMELLLIQTLPVDWQDLAYGDQTPPPIDALMQAARRYAVPAEAVLAADPVGAEGTSPPPPAALAQTEFAPAWPMHADAAAAQAPAGDAAPDDQDQVDEEQGQGPTESMDDAGCAGGSLAEVGA